MRTFTVVLTIGLLKYFGIWVGLPKSTIIVVLTAVALAGIQDVMELFRK
ncbi:hypothetical protein N9064_00510 [bacterium]|nr:hypothetical protein [bacterium]